VSKTTPSVPAAKPQPAAPDISVPTTTKPELPPVTDAPGLSAKVTDAPAELTPPPQVEEEPLSSEMLRLRSKVRYTLQSYYHERVTTVEYSPWGIMHAFIAFGVDTEIQTGNGKVNAIGWLCYNGAGRGMQMLYVENGKLRLRLGPGYQGHAGQFLAMLAQ